MKTKEILIKIFIVFLFVIIISIAVLGLLGIKERVGFLSDFNLNIDKTLYINGLDVNETKKLFTLDDKLDYNSITNYIFTNDSITNYSYDFRIKYYSKVFRNSDIYDVYPKIENILNNNNFIKEIKMGEKGSPFGDFISSKIIYTEKIDNIKYNLKIKLHFILLLVLLLCLFFLILFINQILKILLLTFRNIYYFLLNNKYYSNRNNINLITFVLLFPIIYLLYEYLYLPIYYYYMFDSTSIYTKDILLVSSGLMPEHLIYPNLVPLVLFKIIFIPLGKFFNIISNVTFFDLNNALNPYFVYAELAEYSLLIFRISFLLFLVFMFINGIKIINKYIKINNAVIYFYISITIFMYFFVYYKSLYFPFLYTFNVIRYETMGLLFSSIALYFIILSSETDNCYNNKHKLFIFISGLFVGSAILSKITLSGWVVIIFITYLILNLDKLNNDNNINLNKINFILILFTTILIIFNIVLYIKFYKHDIIESALLYKIDSKKLLYMQTLVPLFFIILSLITTLINFNKIQVSNKIKILLYNFIIYSVSIFLTILFSLLLPNSFDSLMNCYIFSYGGGGILSHLGSKYEHGTAVVNALRYLLITLSIFIFLFTLFFVFINKIKKIIYNTKVLRILLLILLVLLSFIFMNTIRKGGTDLLISIYIVKFSLILFYCNLFIFNNNNKFHIFLILILSVVLSINSFLSIKLLKNTLTSYAVTTDVQYNQKRWKSHTYNTDRGVMFTNMMLSSYSNNYIWDSSFYWARDVKKTKSLLSQTGHGLNDTIIASEGSFISKKSNECISNIDENISGGLLLPLNKENNYVYLRRDYDFYFITDIKYSKEDNRIIYTNFDFYINKNKYFVYKLTMSSFEELDYGYNGDFNFKNKEDFINRGFILINDRLAKGL